MTKQIVTLVMFTLDTREHKVEQTNLSCKERDEGYYPLSNSPYISPDREILKDSLGQFHKCKGFYRMICLKEDNVKMFTEFSKKTMEALTEDYKYVNKLLFENNDKDCVSKRLEELLKSFDDSFKTANQPSFKFHVCVYTITVPELTGNLFPDFKTYVHYAISHTGQDRYNHLASWTEGETSLPNCYEVKFDKKGKANISADAVILPMTTKNDPLISISRSYLKIDSFTNKNLGKIINRNIEEYFIAVKKGNN